MSPNRNTLGLVLGVLGVLCFAGTLPATRVATPYLDAWFITALRAVIAAGLAAVTLIVMRCRVPPREHWAALGIGSLCLVLGFPLFSALAMQSVPAAHGGVVLGILPLATAAAAALIAGERPSAGFWIAAAIGTALVVAFALRGGGGGLAIGDLWLLCTVVVGSVGYTIGGKLTRTMPGWEVICWELMIGLPFMAALTLWLWPANAVNVPVSAWAAVLYVGVFSQFVGFFFWNAGLAMGGISRVGQTMLLQPFVIVLMAAAINGEPLEFSTVLFATAVIASVFIGQRMRVAR